MARYRVDANIGDWNLTGPGGNPFYTGPGNVPALDSGQIGWLKKNLPGYKGSSSGAPDSMNMSAGGGGGGSGGGGVVPFAPGPQEALLKSIFFGAATGHGGPQLAQ